MNICLISSEYPTDSHKGGIATYTENAARGLTRLGQSVTVITESNVNEASVRIEDGVRVVRLALPSRRPYLLRHAQAVRAAIEALPQRPDIIQACEFQAEGWWYALRRPVGAKLVTRLATPTWLVEALSPHSGRGPRVRSYVLDKLERTQTRRSDAVISPTDALAEIVARQWHIPRNRITTVRTGVDFAERFSGDAADLPDELRGHEYMLYFGRLEERKGVHILAEALPAVLASNPSVHMVFVGDVNEFEGEPIRLLIERRSEAYRDRLHFFPKLPQKQLFPIVSRALVAVLPSLWENLANTCLEALDAGTPVVATLGNGFGEVIEDGESGLLVPPSDAPALREALLSLLNDRQHLQHMSDQAKLRASAFSLATVTRDLLSFYESLREPAYSFERMEQISG